MWAMQYTIWSYYAGFVWMEACMIASGLSYSVAADGTVEYNSLRAVSIWNITKCYELVTYLRYWNISIHNWLKYYVMIRLMDKSKKGPGLFASITTFAVSACWHGLAPGLFLFSYGCFALTAIYPKFANTSLPAILPPFLWKAISFCFTHFMVSIFGMSFVWKFHYRYIMMHRAFYHYPMIVLTAVLALSFVLPQNSKKTTKTD